MERTERLLDLVALLLDARELVPFAELREHFPDDYGGSQEAATRKLERDKVELIQLGVPIEYVEAGDDRELGGYRIDRKAFFLDDPKLTPEEALALYAAGAAAIAARDFPFAQDLAHALRKISLSGDPKKLGDANVQAGARRLLVVRPGDPARAGKLRALGGAVARKKKVHLVYRGVGFRPESSQQTERDVDPYGLAFRAGAWRLVAFCHLRQALRVFLVDRVEDLQVNEQRPNQPDFEVPAGFDAGEVAGARPWHWAGSEQTEVTLRFASGSELLAEREFDAAPATIQALEGGGARTTQKISYLQGLIPHLLSFGDRVWLEAPEAARARVVDELTRLQKQLEAAPVAVPSEAPPITTPAANEPLKRPRSKPPPESSAVPPDKRERLRRLLLIVPAARKRPGVKVEDLAHELGLDPAELLADIDLLSLVGRPPFTPDNLIDISIDEKNRVHVTLDQSFSKPPQLTVLEALALTAAAQEAAPADPAVSAALGKLTGSLPGPARQLYSALAQRVTTATPPPVGTQPLLEKIRAAAQSRRELAVEYDKEGRGAFEERLFHPWAVVDHGGRWYLYGFDAVRAATRTFRVDRVRAVRETGQAFADPGPLDPKLFERDEMFFPTGAGGHITLRFSPLAAAWASSRWGTKARPLEGGGVEIDLSAAGPAYAISLAMSFVGEAAIVHPPEARAALRDAVAATLARYRS